MEKKPCAFVILHGSWQSAEAWKPVASVLKKAGFPVFMLDLPGHGANADIPFPAINLPTYVTYVCQQIQHLNKVVPVTLIGHSMSGMVISQVAQSIPVKQLIYVAAFLPVDGECLTDIAKHSRIIGLSKNMNTDLMRKSITLDKNGLDRIFYNGCTKEATDLAISRLQAEPLLPFYGRVHLTADKFGSVPKHYIECLYDYSISIELQRYMQNRWPCSVTSLESGHAPHYAMPEELAQMILDCTLPNA